MDHETVRLKNEIAKMQRKLTTNQQEFMTLQSQYEDVIRKLDRFSAFSLPEEVVETAPLDSLETIEEGTSEDILVQEPMYHSSKNRLMRLFLGYPEIGKDDNIETVGPSLWQYVLVFPNPDDPSMNQSAVTEAEAMLIFQQCFSSRWRDKSGQGSILEKEAFRKAFETLDSFKTGKKMYLGGRLRTIGDRKFEDSLQPPKDFCTLLRNVILVKLTRNLRIHARQLLASNGSAIYIVLYGSDPVLELEAERTQFNAQFSVALTDFSSLEPCDSLQRPLWSLVKPSNVEEIMDELKTFSIVKEIYKTSESEFIGDKETVHEPVGITPGHWNSYRMLLYEVSQGLKMCDGNQKKNSVFSFLYFSKLLEDSLRKVNSIVPPANRLRNLWDWLGIAKPIGAWADFTQEIDPETLEFKYRNLWRNYNSDEQGHRSIFRNMEKVKLLRSLLSTELVLHHLTNSHIVMEEFPLHCRIELEDSQEVEWTDPEVQEFNRWMMFLEKQPSVGGLKTTWKSKFWDFRQPLNKIRNYFGEKIGFYFGFTSLLAKVLITPALVGIFVFAIQRSVNPDTTLGIAVNAMYCIFISCWATVFLEMWRRREARLAVTWGMLDFTQDEQPRPEFSGEPRRSPVNDDLEAPYFSSFQLKIRIGKAMGLSLGLILLVVSIVTGMYLLRWQLTSKLTFFGIDFASPIVSIGNAVQIQIFNFVYKALALQLTDNENHRTQSQYENSLVLKIFLFQFTNSFISLYYTAFVKTNVEGCAVTNADGSKTAVIGASCFNDLFTQLLILFLVAYVKNLVEVGLPYVNHVSRKRKIRNRTTHTHAKSALAASVNDDQVRDEVEDQLSLQAYVSKGIDSTYEEFMEIAIMYGYITVFALAFPLSASLSVISALMEIQVDRFKFLTLVRRPQPTGARTIGIWWPIFQNTTLIAIFTNAGIFCFTLDTFSSLLPSTLMKLIPFALIILILLVFRLLLKNLIPDVSEKYEILMKRHENIVARHIQSHNKKEVSQLDKEEALNFRVFSVARQSEARLLSMNDTRIRR